MTFTRPPCLLLSKLVPRAAVRSTAHAHLEFNITFGLLNNAWRSANFEFTRVVLKPAQSLLGVICDGANLDLFCKAKIIQLFKLFSSKHSA